MKKTKAPAKKTKRIIPKQITMSLELYLNTPLQIKSGSIKEFIALCSIACIMVENGKVIIYLNDDKKIIVTTDMIEFRGVLPAPHFLEVHQSFIINYHHIKYIHPGDGGMVEFSNGLKANISRINKKPLSDLMDSISVIVPGEATVKKIKRGEVIILKPPIKKK